MYNDIYIIERENDVFKVFNYLQDSESKVGLVIPNNTDISRFNNKSNNIEIIEFSIESETSEELKFLSYKLYKRLTYKEENLDNFITEYEYFYAYFKNRYIIESLKTRYPFSDFVIENNLLNNILYEELSKEKKFVRLFSFNSSLDCLRTRSYLNVRKNIENMLRQVQHKTHFYPSIVFNNNFYAKKLSVFARNQKKNVLINASFHINYARVLVPLEKILLEKGYEIYYLAKTMKVAKFLKRNSRQRVINIQQLLNWRDLYNEEPQILEISTADKLIEAFLFNKKGKISEFTKYYLAVKRLFENNDFDLVISADDVEPFGRYIVKSAKNKKIKTINVQHGYIADKYNYSSTISDVMLTWDDLSSDVITKYKTSNTLIKTVGPPHLSDLKINNIRSEECILISWFPNPNIYSGEISKLEDSIDNIIELLQNYSKSKIKFIIKIHPFDTLKKYSKILREYKNSNIVIEIYQNEMNPIEVVLNSDFVLAMNSSIVYEAYLLDIPIIAYNPYSEELNPLLIPYYNEIVGNNNELNLVLNRMIDLIDKVKHPSENLEIFDFNEVRNLLSNKS